MTRTGNRLHLGQFGLYRSTRSTPTISETHRLSHGLEMTRRLVDQTAETNPFNPITTTPSLSRTLRTRSNDDEARTSPCRHRRDLRLRARRRLGSRVERREVQSRRIPRSRPSPSLPTPNATTRTGRTNNLPGTLGRDGRANGTSSRQTRLGRRLRCPSDSDSITTTKTAMASTESSRRTQRRVRGIPSTLGTVYRRRDRGRPRSINERTVGKRQRREEEGETRPSFLPLLRLARVPMTPLSRGRGHTRPLRPARP